MTTTNTDSRKEQLRKAQANFRAKRKAHTKAALRDIQSIDKSQNAIRKALNFLQKSNLDEEYKTLLNEISSEFLLMQSTFDSLKTEISKTVDKKKEPK